MHDLNARLQQHRGQQTRDAADDIDADRQPPTVTQALQPLDQRGDRRRGVLDAEAEQQLAVAAIDGLNPMKVLGHIDADRDSLHRPLLSTRSTDCSRFPSSPYKAINRGA
jgi:hypothetical protein